MRCKHDRRSERSRAEAGHGLEATEGSVKTEEHVVAAGAL